MAESELFDGGQGEGTLRSSLRMAKRAIDNGWPVSPEIRQLVITKAALLVGTSKDARDQIAAMKVLVSADSVNVRRETNELAKEGVGGTNIYGTVNINIVDVKKELPKIEIASTPTIAIEQVDSPHRNGDGTSEDHRKDV